MTPADLVEPGQTHRVSPGSVVLLGTVNGVRNVWRVDIGSGDAHTLEDAGLEMKEGVYY